MDVYVGVHDKNYSLNCELSNIHERAMTSAIKYWLLNTNIPDFVNSLNCILHK